MLTNVTKRLSAMYLVLFLLILSAVSISTKEYKKVDYDSRLGGTVEKPVENSATLTGGVAQTISDILSNTILPKVDIQKNKKNKVKAALMEKSDNKNLIELSEKEIINISVKKTEDTKPRNTWNGPRLTRIMGLNIHGPSGDETFYNDGTERSVVAGMRRRGFSEEKYPYWVRSDGVRMLGSYVMVAANLSIHPRGSIVESSLGTAIVCDTGNFASNHPRRLDIFVTWQD